MSKKLRADLKAGEDDPIIMLATVLSAAWEKYETFFGEPPHGTVKQMAALLELTGEFKGMIIASMDRRTRSERV